MTYQPTMLNAQLLLHATAAVDASGGPRCSKPSRDARWRAAPWLRRLDRVAPPRSSL